MSQIDKVIYFPLLFWFCLLFVFFYFFIFSYFLGYFMYVFKIRLRFFNSLIKLCFNCYYFFEIFVFFIISFLKKKFNAILGKFLKLKFMNKVSLQIKKQAII